jgi:uncharacterized cofD-like protein
MEKLGANIVVVGGGTGSFTILSGLRNYTNHTTALVSMADDGGSTGVLRDELGVLPPGDVRQCLVALSESSQVMRELFNYRFPGNSFAAGHSFGNLFLTALEKITGSFSEAVIVASEVLKIAGKVMPMTLDDIRLCMQDETGKIIKSEDKIGESSFDGKKVKLNLEPEAKINPLARDAIMKADIVVFAPGDLYTSLAPALLVKGVDEALKKTSAKLVYICNLVTSHGQTTGYKVNDFADEIERFIGSKRLDCVLYNTEKPGGELLKKYARDGEYGVEYDEKLLNRAHYHAIGKPLLSKTIQKSNPNDTLFARTFIRHDSDILARQIMKIYFS